MTRWSVTHRFDRVALVVVCVTVGFSNSGCDFSTTQQGGGQGPGKRSQKLALSPQEELAIGRQAYRDVLSHPREFGRVVPADRPECRRVRMITDRIIQASEIEPLQREINLRKGYRFEWEVNVLENDQINAFCLPGGKVVVFQGLLRVAKNDDQLATVLSHEISHALAHHSNERIARTKSQGGGFATFRNLAYDREEEAEADHIGIFLMTFADYDPEEAIHFWERMQRVNGGRQLPEILSDHPSDAHRIQNMKAWVPQSKLARRAFDEGRIEPTPAR